MAKESLLSRLGFFLLILQFFVCKSQAQDPCSSYTALFDAATRFRSTAYKFRQGTTPLCDSRLVAGWYRFLHPVGYAMPENNQTDQSKNPQMNHCGTMIPCWLGGKHPINTGDTVTHNTCMNVYGTQVCFGVGTITVKKCLNFFVYKLNPTHGCSMAYCAGKAILKTFD